MNTHVKHFVDGGFPRIARLYRKLRDKRWFAGLKEMDTCTGLALVADPGQLKAVTESNEMPYLRTLVAEADVFVDVGANLGLFSCIAAKMGKYVVAVEPHPLMIQLLLNNLQRNRLDRDFEVHSTALSERQGIANLFGGRQGGSLLRGWGGIQSNYHNVVFVNTLDRLLEGRFLEHRLLIKVDVEGNEHSLLLGATETLGRKRAPTWMVEIGLTENFAGSINPHYCAIFETFWSYGYRANPMARPAQRVDRADLERWIANRKTDHGDINYCFVKDAAMATQAAHGQKC